MSAPNKDQADFGALLEAHGVPILSRSGREVRIAAVWRGGDGDSVSIQTDTGLWYDHVAKDGGGWRKLIGKDYLALGEGMERPEVDVEGVQKKDKAARKNRVEEARSGWKAADNLNDAMIEKVLRDPMLSNRKREAKLKGMEHIMAMRGYLESRGPGILAAAIRASARALRGTHKLNGGKVGQGRPCVLWPEAHPVDGKVVGIRREWGRGHDNKRSKGLHLVPRDPKANLTDQTKDKHSCAVPIPPAVKMRGGDLDLAEGPINGCALSSAQETTWVLSFGDTTGLSMPARPIVKAAIERWGLQRLVFAGDSGGPGIEAALKGIRKVQGWKLKVPIVWTVPPEGWDWADLLSLDGLYEGLDGRDVVRECREHGMRPLPPEGYDPDRDSVVSGWQPWRKVEPALPAAAGVAAMLIDAAREVLYKEGFKRSVDDYCEWLILKKTPKFVGWMFRAKQSQTEVPADADLPLTDLRALVCMAQDIGRMECGRTHPFHELEGGVYKNALRYQYWLNNWIDKGRKPVPIKPVLAMTTTGSGKSSLTRALITRGDLADKIRAHGGAVGVATHTHDAASPYIKAVAVKEAEEDWVQREGRELWGRNGNKESDGYCPNPGDMMKSVEGKHMPQVELCFRCPNGLKWSLGRHDQGSKTWLAAQASLKSMGFPEGSEKFEKLEACIWQDHKIDCMQSRVLVMVGQSYSETMGTWFDGEEEIPRFMIWDEGTPMYENIEITTTDLSMWAKAVKERLERCEQRHEAALGGDVDDDAQSQMTGVLRAVLPLFEALGKAIGKKVVKGGRIVVGTELREALNKVLEANKGASVAVWEELQFNGDGSLRGSPLRAAFAIASTLKVDEGRVENGKLHVTGLKPIMDRLGRLPLFIADATPDLVTIAAIQAHEGRIVRAIARQNIRIEIYGQRFWGRKAFGKGADADYRQRETDRYIRLIKMFPGNGDIVHNTVRDAIDPPDEHGERLFDLVTHWGLGHRAHDDFAGRGLVICGSFFPPSVSWATAYQGARVAALTAGADPAMWPAIDGEIEMEENPWVREGTYERQSRHPLPKDPHIRRWLLHHATAETVQAIGRARGVNHEGAPLIIRIFGGLPLTGLEAHGLEIAEYKTDPDEIRGEGMKKALADRQAVAEAIEAGSYTIREIRNWIAKTTGGRVPSIERVRRIRAELEKIARVKGEDVDAVVAKTAERADAYLADADGNLARAARRARDAQDVTAAMLLDAALEVEAPNDDAPAATIAATGPPAA
jgi:hypothetical protein